MLHVAILPISTMLPVAVLIIAIMTPPHVAINYSVACATCQYSVCCCYIACCYYYVASVTYVSVAMPPVAMLHSGSTLCRLLPRT